MSFLHLSTVTAPAPSSSLPHDTCSASSAGDRHLALFLCLHIILFLLSLKMKPGDRVVRHYALSWLAVVTCPKASAAHLDGWLAAVCAADLGILAAAAAAVAAARDWKAEVVVERLAEFLEKWSPAFR